MKKCFKIRYSEEEAEAELRKARREYKKWFGFTSRQERRVYFCYQCGAYHLTSISQNVSELIAKKKKDQRKARDKEIIEKLKNKKHA